VGVHTVWSFTDARPGLPRRVCDVDFWAHYAPGLYLLWSDGCCLQQQGVAVYGAVLHSVGDGFQMWKLDAKWHFLGDGRNNGAELAGLAAKLDFIAIHGDPAFSYYAKSDSGVVGIVLGVKRCRNERLLVVLLQVFRGPCCACSGGGFAAHLRYISHIYNGRADQLSKHAALLRVSWRWLQHVAVEPD